MSSPSPITGELSNSKVAAVFASEDAARSAAQSVRASLGLGEAQVQVVTPGDRHPGRKLEPESRGIFRTILVAHLRFGIAGLVLGLLLFGLLYARGLPFIVQSPWAAALAIMFFAGVAGLMFGGLVSLRPDHDPYIQAVRGALAAGRSAVVVHAFSSEQRDQAGAALRALGGDITATL